MLCPSHLAILPANVSNRTTEVLLVKITVISSNLRISTIKKVKKLSVYNLCEAGGRMDGEAIHPVAASLTE